MERWEWEDAPARLRRNPRVLAETRGRWDMGSEESRRQSRSRERAVLTTAPSFSSSLLDAIYRSIDEEGRDDERKPTARRLDPVDPLLLLDHPSGKKLGRLQLYPSSAARHGGGASSSSSSESSYGGVCSSEPESCRPAAGADGGGKKPSSIRSKLRQSRLYRELKKPRTPSSPGARLAAFLNSLFPAKTRPAPPPPATCSSAPPMSRSCLGRPPRGGRSVRFDVAPAPAPPAPEDNRRRDAMLGLAFDDDEEEDDDVASCASSDLFELEYLDGLDAPEIYRDELPVYGTTRIETTTAVSRGLLV